MEIETNRLLRKVEGKTRKTGKTTSHKSKTLKTKTNTRNEEVLYIKKTTILD